MVLFAVLLCFSTLAHSENAPYFLSSDRIVQEKQSSLKGLRSFTFFPKLKLEKKQATTTMNLIEEELRKVGQVVKKPLLTPEGADLESFSYPTLQLGIEQLVDQNDRPLPVLQASLSITTSVEVIRTKELSSLNISRWTTYIKKTNDVQEIIKKTLPILLNQFAAEYEQANRNDPRPTIYIGYDDSWWTQGN